MSAESRIYDALRTDAGVTALVSTRIFQQVVSGGEDLPAIAVQRSNTEFTNTIYSGIPIASKVTFDIVCVAKDYPTAENVCDAVIAIPQPPPPTTPIRAINRISTYDPDTEMFAAILTIEVWEA